MKRAFKVTLGEATATLVYDEETGTLTPSHLGLPFLSFEHAKDALSRVYAVSEDDETAALTEQLNGRGDG